MAVLLALASAIVYGAADFSGGFASRRAPSLAVVALSQATGLVAMALAVLVTGGSPTVADLGWGAAGGAIGLVGLVLFYRALATGTMSVVAPVTAVTAAAVPVLAGFGLGERIPAAGVLGVLLALVAIVLVSAEQGLPSLDSFRRARLGAPLVAGLSFGAFFVVLAQTTRAAGLWPLVSARTCSVGALLVATLLLRPLAGRRLVLPAAVLPLVATAGALDVTANSLYLVATRHGELAVTGLLSSLYPVSTVVLAQVVLGERLARTQAVGLGVATAAVALIALP